MSIGFNRYKSLSGLLTVVLAAFFTAMPVFAATVQLDVLGLIPGESDLLQVKKASANPDSKDDERAWFEIGGHKVPCSMSFRNGKLDSLHCLTGKGARAHQQYTEASNVEVHSTLLLGFAKKFGEPSSLDNEVVRTQMGVEHKQQLVTWVDERGNKLQLISVFSTVNAGVITFESSEFLRERAERAAVRNAQKKF